MIDWTHNIWSMWTLENLQNPRHSRSAINVAKKVSLVTILTSFWDMYRKYDFSCFLYFLGNAWYRYSFFCVARMRKKRTYSPSSRRNRNTFVNELELVEYI